MCDFSLQHVASRPAKVGDKLVTTNFGTGTNGFMPADQASDQSKVAVCLLPGTELAFENVIESRSYLYPKTRTTKVARFTQIDKDVLCAHHDALELPDGEIVKLTALVEDQKATVLQLPAAPKTKEEAEAQRRVAFVG